MEFDRSLSLQEDERKDMRKKERMLFMLRLFFPFGFILLLFYCINNCEAIWKCYLESDV